MLDHQKEKEKEVKLIVQKRLWDAGYCHSAGEKKGEEKDGKRPD